MTIKIRLKSVYGNTLIYPANEIAEQLVKLTGRKTFNKDDLKIVKELGYTIEQIDTFLEGIDQ